MFFSVNLVISPEDSKAEKLLHFKIKSVIFNLLIILIFFLINIIFVGIFLNT